MATLEENIRQANSDFQAIKAKIIENGVEVSNGTKTEEYAAKVANVYEVGYKKGLSEAPKLTIAPLEITKNGTYIADSTVAGYSPIIVNVESDGAALARSIVDGTITEYSDSEVTSVGDYGLNHRAALTSVNLPNATVIGNYAFEYCQALTSVNLPKVTSVGSYTFENCSSLTSISLPELTTITGSYAFGYCSSLASVNLPKLVDSSGMTFYYCPMLPSINLPELARVGTNMFKSDYVLTSVDVPKANMILNGSFDSCYSLKAVILRSATLCTLANTNAFTKCYHILGTVNATYNPEGLKDGYIYVPAALVDTYKTATNWVTYADQIRALEDYTVDGTITGELDETKI